LSGPRSRLYRKK